jgi:hypothetical protein
VQRKRVKEKMAAFALSLAVAVLGVVDFSTTAVGRKLYESATQRGSMLYY